MKDELEESLVEQSLDKGETAQGLEEQDLDEGEKEQGLAEQNLDAGEMVAVTDDTGQPPGQRGDGHPADVEVKKPELPLGLAPQLNGSTLGQSWGKPTGKNQVQPGPSCS